MQRLSPNRTVVTSFNPKNVNSVLPCSSSSRSDDPHGYYDDGDWVLCVAAQYPNEGGVVACALSNGELQLYDQSTMHLLQTFHRSNLVTEITFETFRANVLAATADDGSLTLYDVRQRQSPAMEFKKMLRPDEETLTLSVGYDGNISAVGSSKGKIHFFDLRSNHRILGSYTQAHTSDVTRVRFQSAQTLGTTRSTTSLLASGSEDGLAVVFDTSQPTEESAIVNILPVQSPIRELGFFGPHSEAIYCLTGSENLQLYHMDSSICRKDFGLQFREYLRDQVSAHRQHLPNVTEDSLMIDYLVDCYWDPGRQELSLLAGSSKGDAALFQVEEQGVLPQYFLHGGHRGVVRAWHPYHNAGSFLTVGEDARMCEWSRTPTLAPSSLSDEMTVTSNAKAHHEIIMPIQTRKRTGPPIGVGGGKLRKPRSRLTSSPY